MSTYFAILTDVGEAKLANAIALGRTIKLATLAVGDGNGNLPMPSSTQKALVHEVRRAGLNQLTVDPANASQIIVEQVLPEDVGGWWIREIGIYDEAGDLCAVANCPPSYKPLMVEGSGRTQVVRVVLIVASTGAVELKIDPSVVLATRKYADDKVTEAVMAHEAKANPHPQYLSKIDGENKIAAAIAALVDSSPETLNTLAELAEALGRDPHFATTITNALALKAPLASPEFTGAPKTPNITFGDDSQRLVNAHTLIEATQGRASVQGLVGANNAASPLNKFTVSALAVTMRNPATGQTITRYGTGTLTADLSVVGANGRDQVAVISGTSAVHLHYIFNPITGVTALLWSASASAPMLPAGFAFFAYATTVRYQGANVITAMMAYGSKIFYTIDSSATRVLSGGAVTSPPSFVDCSQYVPSNAARAILRGELQISSSSTATFVLQIQVFNMQFVPIKFSIATANTAMHGAGIFEIPLDNAGRFSYAITAGATGGAYVDVMGYVIPNGDC
ncbi:phage tail protein [Janthinobacterium fluminis]|uniref:Phage tail protein n=1 Tax=Janthinobacterium fluminis TaxID=2987524 RepID=A0ABT5JXY8_9BURK|nr:phage tail protein [Janthinobacterium fluminis]MDC8757504.1 phage tail protein [Janthinobacterium fluminis]